MTEAELLAEEIFYVYEKVKTLVTDLDTRPLGANDPHWLPIKIVSDQNYTVRDKKLLEAGYKGTIEDLENLLVACAASLDMASNAKNFHVDHFYPQDTIMGNINNLVTKEALVEDTKAILVNKFKETRKNDATANEIVNKLIKIDKTKTTRIDLRSLKIIYYNFPDNLWPLSSSSNTSKGKVESIQFVIRKILSKAEKIGSRALIGLIQSVTPEITEDLIRESISTNKIDKKKFLEQTANNVSKKMAVNFNKKIDTTNFQILPNYVEFDTRYFYLDFFTSQEIGKACLKLSKELSKNARRAFSLAKVLTASTVNISLARSVDIQQQLLNLKEAEREVIKFALHQVTTTKRKRLHEMGLDDDSVQLSLGSSIRSLDDSPSRETLHRLFDESLLFHQNLQQSPLHSTEEIPSDEQEEGDRMSNEPSLILSYREVLNCLEAKQEVKDDLTTVTFNAKNLPNLRRLRCKIQ